MDKEKYLIKLKKLMFNNENIVFAVVFGSFVENEKKFNDIDIGIYFKNAPKGLELLDYINNICNLLKYNIDIIVLNSAKAFLRHQVFKTGKAIIIKDQNIYSDFREKTITDYQEYKYISGLDTYDR